MASAEQDVILATQKGQSIRFAVDSVRASLRTSGGVSGIRLAAEDKVISLEVAIADEFLLTITANGYGKLTPITRYPLQRRAGSGVRTFRLTGKTGDVAAVKAVSPEQQVMFISAEGIVIRTPARERDPKKGITIQGRSTQGVRLMRLDDGDYVVAVTSFLSTST
jgi:DNA gyrase subunit A